MNSLRGKIREIGSIFVFLAVIGMLGVLSTRYKTSFDWTVGARNTLHHASRDLLQRMRKPILVTAYVTEDELFRRRIHRLLTRYQQQKADFQIRFVDPEVVPHEVRAKGVSVDGELIIRYEAREEHVTTHSEQEITNALSRLALSEKQFVAYLTGHGERDLLGDRNHDLGNIGRQLEQRGYQLQPLNLERTGAVPDNLSMLVLGDPSAAWLPAVARKLTDYLAGGGNLLWLADSDQRLPALAASLGIDFLPGPVLDPATRQFGIEDTAYTLITRYPAHRVTDGFNLVTLFPHARAMTARQVSGWQTTNLLTTGANAWVESSPGSSNLTFDANSDVPGPLSIGLALERESPKSDRTRQRVVVVGDGDFLSNAFLGNGGNLNLGLNLFNWLSGNHVLLNIPPVSAPDLRLDLSTTAQAIIGLGSLFGVPLLLLGSAVAVWRRRRRA